ncbi:hypothetical protein E4U42_003989 [Claviceps africana]|uniref:BAH domain-containing protein n=1 Tax=Claviceps africana TaxID=83212 RepID=A0A8K0J5Z7_9HYPO|nr:hypothetical protein E4U42_003989 [Claviceps africana]
MSSKSRKRSRPVSDENRADCPFTVTAVAAPSLENRHHISKKRKRGDGENGGAAGHGRRELIQVSPFEPRGRFKSNQSMNLVYTVEPQKQWLEMTRYNSFVLNGSKYTHDEFVYIANDATIELQKATGKNADGGSLPQSTDYWVARILEVRASDELHVYARIFWMYSPDELPAGTLDGKKTIAGRQPYHGQNELIASNHMDVINVVSVAMKATVQQWIETDDDEVQDALYWRQAFNCRTSQVSSVELTCKCKTPANPDKTLVGCTNSECDNWLHYECLLHDALMQVYERLGTELPHKSGKTEDSTVKLEHELEQEHEIEIETEDEVSRQPLTPTENKKEEHTPSASDVGGSQENGSRTRFSFRRSESTPKAATQTLTPGPSNSVGQRSAKSASTKKGRGKKTVEERPYDGLFQATLRMKEGPMAWEITDLRPNIQGGDRTWTERAACLVCKHLID